jgi:hypothetical protein
MFVSNRPGGCGGGDIYWTAMDPETGWGAVMNLGCEVNSAAEEAGPVLSLAKPAPALYFSSTRPGGLGGSDLYLSWMGAGFTFGPAVQVLGVNSAYDDMQPSIRRDGQELVFASNRPGSLGAFDIWSASRPSTAAPWSEPSNLGPNVNSAASETRPSLSWDGMVLLFGSNRPGGEGAADIYYSIRETAHLAGALIEENVWLPVLSR